MIEVFAVVGIAAVGALWKVALEHGAMKEGMQSILKELQLLRSDLSSDIRELEDDLRDHEGRLRVVERHLDAPPMGGTDYNRRTRRGDLQPPHEFQV